MRAPKPLGGAIDRAKYQETHEALPILMRVFMRGARATAAMLFLVPLVIVFWYLCGGPLAFIAFLILNSITAQMNGTGLDIFQPAGFRLFGWLVRR